MSLNRKTAVEWLAEKIQSAQPNLMIDGLVRYAKELEKLQICNAFNYGYTNLERLSPDKYYLHFYGKINRVTAIKKMSGVLTPGKEYQVVDQTENHFTVIDDYGDKIQLSKSFFDYE